MSDTPKAFNLSPAIHQYLVDHGQQVGPIEQELIDATRALGGIARMQIAPEQGALMGMLTRLIGARRAIEIGTFTGYSALAVARALPADGKLICCDISEEWTSIGRPFWERAGVADKIDLRIAPAIETLASIDEPGAFDLAFIDADKGGYWAYYEALLRLIRPGGLILVDNVLWGGSVVDADNQEDDTRSIRDFNDRVAKDPRVDCVMLAVSDGLSFLRVC